MKTRLLSALTTRLQVLCAAAALGLLAAGTVSTVAAQEATAPAATEAPATTAPADAAPEPVAAPSAAAATAAPAAEIVDKGDVAWMLTSTLLVLMMVVPGLALFYGGMVRAKNVLSVLIQVITVFSLIAILWVAYGYSLAFSGDGKWIGNLDKLFLKGVTTETLAATFTKGVSLPEQVFVCFQLTFAGITGALIVGAFAERVKFAAVLLFALIWFTAGYLPIAHMVWATGGFLFERGALDFAGGTVVHLNAGVAGLVGSYFVGKRIGFGQVALRPHNVNYTFVGAALLWVGWFGFNAGSNLEANAGAALAFLNTMLATAAAILAWALAEKLFKGKSSALGVASGAVAGLAGQNQTRTTLRTELGLRVSQKLSLGGYKAALSGQIAWGHYALREAEFTASVAGLAGSAFTITGARPARDVMLLSTGLDLELAPNITFGSRFDLNAGQNTRSYAGSAVLRASF